MQIGSVAEVPPACPGPVVRSSRGLSEGPLVEGLVGRDYRRATPVHRRVGSRNSDGSTQADGVVEWALHPPDLHFPQQLVVLQTLSRPVTHPPSSPRRVDGVSTRGCWAATTPLTPGPCADHVLWDWVVSTCLHDLLRGTLGNGPEQTLWSFGPDYRCAPMLTPTVGRRVDSPPSIPPGWEGPGQVRRGPCCLRCPSRSDGPLGRCPGVDAVVVSGPRGMRRGRGR